MKKTQCLFFWFFAAILVSSASALQITNFLVDNQNGFTKESTPSMLISVEPIEDADEMMFSCNGTDFSSPVWFNGAFDGFDITRLAYGCPVEDGPRSITVRVVHKADERFAEKSFENLKLDRSPPVISNQMPVPQSVENQKRPAIGFDLLDAENGISNPAKQALVKLNQQPKPVLFNGAHASVLLDGDLADGPIVVQVDARDDAGNAQTAKWSFSLDTVANLNSIQINNNDSFSRSKDVLIAINGDADLAFCRFKNGASEFGNWLVFQKEIAFSLEEGEGEKTVTMKCKDNANNETLAQSDSITVDSQPPQAPVLEILSAENQQVVLKWNRVTDNGPSGFKEWTLFKDNAQFAVLNASQNEFVANELSNGSQYVFKLVARDNAGNESFDQKTATLIASPMPSSTGPQNNPTSDASTPVQENRVEQQTKAGLENLPGAQQNPTTNNPILGFEILNNSNTPAVLAGIMAIVALGLLAWKSKPRKK